MDRTKLIAFAVLTALAIATGCNKENTEDPGGKEEEPTWEMFDSDYFETFVDPVTGVVSYLFRSDVFDPAGGTLYNTQSCYFNSKDMTDDQRFCCFFISTKEQNGQMSTERSGRIFDFKTRKLYTFSGNTGCYPYLDPKEDILYFYIMGNKTNSGKTRDNGQFFKKDLLNSPRKTEALAKIPKAVAPSGCYMSRACSHVTLTTDKKKVLLDAWVNNTFIQGLLDLYSGEWTEWSRNNTTHLTHGQMNPKRDDEALFAIDTWEDSYGESHKIVYDNDGAYGGQGTYPRMQLMKPDGTRTTIKPSPDNNYATHEAWLDDGDHVYWCAGGVNIRNIRTGKYEYIYDQRATHCNISSDLKYVTFDNDHPDYYRGGRWKVSFLNRKTGKTVDIITQRPAITTKDKPSQLHPDPHPHFICNNKYIVCTSSDDKGYLRWCITPVDQLIRKTQ